MNTSPSKTPPCGVVPPERPSSSLGQAHAKRPIGIWFYAIALLCLGGVLLAFAALLLPTIGLHAKMWMPILYLGAIVATGTMSAALGAGLWMRLRMAWTAAACIFGGGGLYLAALCTFRLGLQIASGEPLTQYGIPWRTTIMMGLVFSYVLFNRDVRAFFGVQHPLRGRERLRLGVGVGLGVLAVLGLHGLLLVTMLLFPDGRPLAHNKPLLPPLSSRAEPPYSNLQPADSETPIPARPTPPHSQTTSMKIPARHAGTSTSPCQHIPQKEPCTSAFKPLS